MAVMEQLRCAYTGTKQLGDLFQKQKIKGSLWNLCVVYGGLWTSILPSTTTVRILYRGANYFDIALFLIKVANLMVGYSPNASYTLANQDKKRTDPDWLKTYYERGNHAIK